MDEVKLSRMRIEFLGRVQGVGFRATAAGVGGELEVSGWVRNEPGGSVMLEVQGERAEVETFLSELRKRMGRNIREERAVEIPAVMGERGFEVRRW